MINIRYIEGSFREHRNDFLVFSMYSNAWSIYMSFTIGKKVFLCKYLMKGYNIPIFFFLTHVFFLLSWSYVLNQVSTKPDHMGPILQLVILHMTCYVWHIGWKQNLRDCNYATYYQKRKQYHHWKQQEAWPSCKKP